MHGETVKADVRHYCTLLKWDLFIPGHFIPLEELVVGMYGRLVEDDKKYFRYTDKKSGTFHPWKGVCALVCYIAFVHPDGIHRNMNYDRYLGRTDV